MQCMVASGCVQPLLSDSLLHCTSTSCVHCVVVSRCVYALYHMLHNQCQHSALPCTVLFSDTHLKQTYTSATISNIPQDEGDVEFSYIPSDNGTNSSKSKNKSKSDRVLTAAELIAKKRADKALAAQLASETPFETYQRKAKEKKSTSLTTPHLHRFLTEDVGDPRLRDVISKDIAVMQLSDDWFDFMEKLDRVLPLQQQQLKLPFDNIKDDGKGL